MRKVLVLEDEDNIRSFVVLNLNRAGYDTLEATTGEEAVEYSVIKLFMDNPGKALSRDEILESVWGRDYYGEVKIVDVNIRRLRLKVEDDPTNPTYITTVWGYGYKWGF